MNRHRRLCRNTSPQAGTNRTQNRAPNCPEICKSSILRQKNGSGSWIRTSDQVVNRVRVTLIFRSKPFSRHPCYDIKNIRDLSCLFKTKGGKKVGKFCFVDILMGLPKVDNPHFSTYLSEILHHNSSHDKRIFFYIVI